MANTWATKTAMPLALGKLGSASIGSDKAYAVGGTGTGSAPSSTNYEYSQAGNSWLSKTLLPGARYDLMCSTIGADKLYAFCGWSPSVSDTTYEYSQTGNSWATKNVNPVARATHQATTVGSDKAYTYGGYNLKNNNTEYSQAGNSWTAKATSISRHLHNGYAIGNMFYVVGGFGGAGGGSDTNHEYNQPSDVWTARAVVPTTLKSHGASSIGNNDGFTYGHEDSAGFTYRLTYNYAQNTDTWTSKALMPAARKWTQGTTIGSHKGYMFGGTYNVTSDIYQSTNYEYTAFDPVPETALVDLKTFLDAQWPFALIDLKSDVRAFGLLLQDLKTDIRAQSLDALVDLKTSLAAYGWSFADLKTALNAYAQALEDLKCDIATSDIVFKDLKCELKTKDTSGPYVSGNPSPAPNQAGVVVNSNIVIVIKDNGWGVDVNSVWVDVKDNQTGTTTRYKVGVTGFSYTLSSDKRTCTVTIDPTANFEYNRNISVSAFAADLAGNPGLPQVV